MFERIQLSICAASLLSFSGVALGQTARDYLVSARRSGVIQFRDPATLDILSSIDLDLPANSTGLNGVLADPNGRKLYIEGPAHIDPKAASGCCWLYSIDLPSVQAKVAAGIWGTNSRRRFVNAGSSLLITISDVAFAATQGEDDRWQMSPDGRWWAGLRSGPSVDFYDASRNKIVRSFIAEQGNAEWYLNGAWIKDQFYIYTTHDGSGWLWHVSPDSDRLGEALAVRGPVSIEGCEKGIPLITDMSTVGDRLVVNEAFGGTMDRRQHCDAVPGGAWIIDPASQQSVINIASQLYFWHLIPSTDGTSLYGVTSDALFVGSPSQLVKLDAHSGKILKTQSLEGDYWWIAFTSLRSVPTQNRFLPLPVDNTH